MHHNHYQHERKLCKNNVKKINYKISCHLYNIKNLKTGTKIQKNRTYTNAKPQSHMWRSYTFKKGLSNFPNFHPITTLIQY